MSRISRSGPRVLALIGFGLCVLSGAACQSGDDRGLQPAGPWTTLRGQYVTFHARPGDPLLCESYVSEADAKATALFQYLGVDASQRTVADWFQFGQDEFLAGASPCDLDPTKLPTGCAIGKHAYGMAEAIEHELVHAYASALGHPSPLFTEGLAVSLSCRPDPSWYAGGAPPGDWRFFLRVQEMNAWQSAFVSYLLDSFGPEPFVRLYRALSFDASETDVADTFQRVYGESIDTAWSAMLSGKGRLCVGLFSCATPVLETGRLSLGRACDSVLARRLANDSSVVTLAGNGAFPAFCQSTVAVNNLLRFESGSPFWFVPRGQSVALVHDGSSAPVMLDVASAGGFLSTSCDQASPIEVAGPGYVQRALIAPSDSPLYVQFHAPQPLTMLSREYSGHTNHDYSWTVENCGSCADGQATNCSEVSQARQGSFWMKISWGAPFTSEFFALELSVP